MKRLSKLAAAVALAASAGAGHTQEAYPSKPIRLIVNISAGGPVDATARVFGAFMSERVKQPVIVENRPGGASLVGTLAVANAPPDGYTLLVSTSSLPTYEAFLKNPQINVLDLSYVSLLRRTPLLIASTSSFKTLGELIAQGKSKPGALKYGSYGNAIVVYTHSLNDAAGIQAQNIPYKGLAEAAQALARGEVDYLLTTVSSVQPHVTAGRARFLAVAARERARDLPGIPSAPEAGLQSDDITTWAGLLGPRGLPADIVKRLHAEAVAFTRDEGVIKKLRALGFDPVNSTPEEFRNMVQREVAMFNRVAKVIGVQPE